MNDQQKSRAELVAQYNSMATVLGHKVVKDFKSKAIAVQRIEQIKPDYLAYLDDLEAKGRERAEEVVATAEVQAVAGQIIDDVRAGVFQPREAAELPVDNSGKKFKVVLHNNDNTAQWDVVDMLMCAVGMDHNSAQDTMYRAHDDGKADVRSDLTDDEARELLDKIETKRAGMLEDADLMDKRTQEYKRALFIKDLVFTMEAMQ